MKLKVIIADDEALAREGLRLLLTEDQDIEIVEECSNGRETIAAVKEHQADVLFLDIQMPGKDGFEVIQQIGIAQMPVVVFITAHNGICSEGIRGPNALDYLTKPLEAERIQTTLRRVRERLALHKTPTTQEQLTSALAILGDFSDMREKHPKRILVPNGSKDIFVMVNEIEWIEADSYYSCLHVGGKRYCCVRRSSSLRRPLMKRHSSGCIALPS